MFKEFTVGFSRTINLGNFESCRVEASLTVSLPENVKAAEFDTLQKAAQVDLRNLWEDTYKRQYLKKPLETGTAKNE